MRSFLGLVARRGKEGKGEGKGREREVKGRKRVEVFIWRRRIC